MIDERCYPPDVYQKVLKQEAPGGRPVRIDIVIPTVTAPGEAFDVKVALIDEEGFASVCFSGTVSVKGAAGEFYKIEFKEGRPAVGLIRGGRIDEEGLCRFESDLEGVTFYSNPSCCSKSPQYRIFWGDPHVHTLVSDCCSELSRTAHFGYISGRWQTMLDFVATADHVSWDRITRGKWRTQIATSELHNDAPAFVTVPGYEVSLAGGSGGDNNVYTRYWPETWVDEWEGGNTRTLAEKVCEQMAPGDFFVVPHHTSRGGGENAKHGEICDAIFPGEDSLPVLEIHSKWGTSEYSGNPNHLKTAHNGRCYAVDFLAQGIRFGFIAGTDTHVTVPSGYCDVQHLTAEPGLTAVMCDELTRDNVFDAVRTRSCYGTSTERIYLDVKVNGMAMGGLLKCADAAAPREIAVTMAAKSNIDTIEIVRNGQVIHSGAGRGWLSSFAFVDEDDLKEHALTSAYYPSFSYYYVRGTVRSGGQAWSSPVWVDLRE